MNPTSMEVSNKEKKSLFNSICATESMALVDAEISKHAQRVGFVLKVLYNRELTFIRDCFIGQLSTLIQDTCNEIDNELHKTEKAG